MESVEAPKALSRKKIAFRFLYTVFFVILLEILNFARKYYHFLLIFRTNLTILTHKKYHLAIPTFAYFK